MNVAFVGLGQMGTGMAANLIAAGHDVTVWNRNAVKAAPLVARGPGWRQCCPGCEGGYGVHHTCQR